MNKEIEGILFEYDLGETKVTMVKLDQENTLEQMYKVIGCSIVDCVSLPKNIDIWTDDEGMLKSDSAVIHYVIRESNESDGFELHLAGKSLFLSTDKDGNTIGLKNMLGLVFMVLRNKLKYWINEIKLFIQYCFKEYEEDKRYYIDRNKY